MSTAYPLAKCCWGPMCVVIRFTAGFIESQSAKEHPSRSRQCACQQQHGGCSGRAEQDDAPPPLWPQLPIWINTVGRCPAAGLSRCSLSDGARAGINSTDGHEVVCAQEGGGGRCGATCHDVQLSTSVAWWQLDICFAPRHT